MKKVKKQSKIRKCENRVDSTCLKRNFVILLLTQTKKSILSPTFTELKKDFFKHYFVRKPTRNVVNMIVENIQNDTLKREFLNYENLKNLVSLHVYKALPLSLKEEFDQDFLLLSKPNFVLSLREIINLSTPTPFLLYLNKVIDEKLTTPNLDYRIQNNLVKMKDKISFIVSLKEENNKNNFREYIDGRSYISLANLQVALNYACFGHELKKYFMKNISNIKREVLDEEGTKRLITYFAYDEVLNFLENHYIKDGELKHITLEEIPHFYTFKDVLEVFEQKRIGNVYLKQLDYFKITYETDYAKIKKATGKALYRAEDIYNFINKLRELHREKWCLRKTEKLNELMLKNA